MDLYIAKWEGRGLLFTPLRRAAGILFWFLISKPFSSEKSVFVLFLFFFFLFLAGVFCMLREVPVVCFFFLYHLLAASQNCNLYIKL